MKKSLNYALAYAILALCGGVFYREFTRFNNFSGTTALGKIHTHFFMLGMVMYLIIALFARHYDLYSMKTFKAFRGIYNTGVPMTGIMLGFRGFFDVLPDKLTVGADKAISGIGGIGHILTGVGIILLLIALKKASSEKPEVKTDAADKDGEEVKTTVE